MSESLEAYRDELAAKIGKSDDVEAKRLEQRKVIIESLANGSTITDAAKAARCSRETLYQWRNLDADFRAAFDSAREAGQGAHEFEIATLRADLRLKAIRALVKALDGEQVERWQLTAAIFVAKAELGMIETSRVQTQDITPIIDDIPDDA